MKRRPLTWIDQSLLGIAVLCLAVGGAELAWRHPLEVFVEPPSPVAETTDQVVSKSTHRSFADYSDVVARPLFTIDRRPYEVPVEPSPPREPARPPVVARPEFWLRAVISTSEAQIALVAVGDAPEIHKLRLGDQVEGWTLAEVSRASIYLERRGERILVELNPEDPSDDATTDTHASVNRRRNRG